MMEALDPQEKKDRIEAALKNLSGQESRCRLCPRECGVNRKKGEKGFCQSGSQAAVSCALLHYGEEPVLSGVHDCAREAGQLGLKSGSGTIFISGCNLKCLFCQNYQISWLNRGDTLSDEKLAEAMLRLQDLGALNINLVSPTHLLLPILRALAKAYARGLALPVVYNSNGYEKAEVIKECEGIIDIYLPDLKYYSPWVSKKFADVSDYFLWASAAVREMSRQQPELVLDADEIAWKGLIVRHLALPGMTEDSLAILDWIEKNLSPFACLSLMSQYYPRFKAPQEIQRTLLPEEFQVLKARAERLGLETIFIQPKPFSPDERRLPDFDLNEPFEWG